MSQHEFIPTLNPGENYWDAIPKRDAAVHASQEDDFSTLLPHVPVGEVLPDAVVVDGAIVAPPKQARRYASSSQAGLASFAPLLDKLGPGAGAMVERELDRARAFEVIARAAVAWVDSRPDFYAAAQALDVLREAVAENRAAVQA